MGPKPEAVSDTPAKFNSSPLKNGGWKTILSYLEGNLSGAMLNFGRVHLGKLTWNPKSWRFGSDDFLCSMGWFLGFQPWIFRRLLFGWILSEVLSIGQMVDFWLFCGRDTKWFWFLGDTTNGFWDGGTLGHWMCFASLELWFKMFCGKRDIRFHFRWRCFLFGSFSWTFEFVMKFK